MMSISEQQLRGLNRLGDILCPETATLPRFSDTQVAQGLQIALPHMDAAEVESVHMLLRIASKTPRMVLAGLLFFLNRCAWLPLASFAELRRAQLGVTGLVFSLYYGFNDPHYAAHMRSAIGWDAAIRSAPMTEPNVTTQWVTDNFPNHIFDHKESNMTDANLIYQVSREAFAEVSAIPLTERVGLVKRLLHLILSQKNMIATRLINDFGKVPVDVASSEIFPTLETLEWLVHNAEKVLKDEKVPTPLAMMGKKSQVWYEPLGTVLVIAPWNYPFYQAIVPIAISFIAGNSTVFKPSEFTPLTGLVEELLLAAGFKPNWVQVIYGDGLTGAALVDGDADKIFFTGSLRTGRKIAVVAADKLIPTELELGGKDPMIVFADADVGRVAAGALWGAMTNTGQSCTSVERLYVAEPIYATVRDRLVVLANQMRSGTSADSDIGRMITAPQINIVRDLLNDALLKGARQLTGMDWDKSDAFIPPIILENCTADMRLMQEEIFGPILPIFAFQTEQEAIELANDSEFGLSASVWGADKQQVERVARRLNVGNVSVNNVMVSEGNHNLPFGGRKLSGVGRYKGRDGLRSFTAPKSVLIDSPSKKIEAHWYPFTAQKLTLFNRLMDGLFRGGVMGVLGFAKNGMSLESLAQKLGKGKWRE